MSSNAAQVLEEYLTIEELSARLKIKPKTIKNKMAAGTFRKGVHYSSPKGIRPRFKWSMVVAWLEAKDGTSVAMIEKHYGKYMRNDSEEQLSRLLGVKSATLSATLASQGSEKQGQVANISGKEGWWAHLDSNQGPTGYEPVALTN